jgi:hypothetical protein
MLIEKMKRKSSNSVVKYEYCFENAVGLNWEKKPRNLEKNLQ